MADTSSQIGSMNDVAAGQRLMIIAIAIYILAIILSGAVSRSIGGLAGLAVVVVAIIGVWRTSTALGYSTGRKVLYVVGLFLPLVGLILLAVVNAEATKVLRGHGYKVGFFGAKAS